MLAAVDAAAGPDGGRALRRLHAGLARRRRAAGPVAGVALIGGFPPPTGSRTPTSSRPTDGVMPFPGWGPFEGPDSADLDEETRTRIAAAAIPVPEGVAKAGSRLTDERRLRRPHPARVPRVHPRPGPGVDRRRRGARARAARRTSTFVDIDSGHWPMFTRPAELARLLPDLAEAV